MLAVVTAYALRHDITATFANAVRHFCQRVAVMTATQKQWWDHGNFCQRVAVTFAFAMQS